MNEYLHPPYRYATPQFGEFGALASVNGRLVCHICGRDYLSLQTHVWGTHGLSATEYRETFRLLPTVPLWSPDVSRKLAEANRRRMESDPNHLPSMTNSAAILSAERREGKREPRKPVNPLTLELKSHQMRTRWAHVSADARSAKGRELSQASRAWWDAHPEARAARAERIKRLGTGHKWGLVGEANPQAKLTAADVGAIRKGYADGERTADLARLHGVSKSLIWLVVTRRVWKSVTP